MSFEVVFPMVSQISLASFSITEEQEAPPPPLCDPTHHLLKGASSHPGRAFKSCSRVSALIYEETLYFHRGDFHSPVSNPPAGPLCSVNLLSAWTCKAWVSVHRVWGVHGSQLTASGGCVGISACVWGLRGSQLTASGGSSPKYRNLDVLSSSVFQSCQGIGFVEFYLFSLFSSVSPPRRYVCYFRCAQGPASATRNSPINLLFKLQVTLAVSPLLAVSLPFPRSGVLGEKRGTFLLPPSGGPGPGWRGSFHGSLLGGAARPEHGSASCARRRD